LAAKDIAPAMMDICQRIVDNGNYDNTELVIGYLESLAGKNVSYAISCAGFS